MVLMVAGCPTAQLPAPFCAALEQIFKIQKNVLAGARLCQKDHVWHLPHLSFALRMILSGGIIRPLPEDLRAVLLA